MRARILADLTVSAQLRGGTNSPVAWLNRGKGKEKESQSELAIQTTDLYTYGDFLRWVCRRSVIKSKWALIGSDLVSLKAIVDVRWHP
jgi:hypothetical protein